MTLTSNTPIYIYDATEGKYYTLSNGTGDPNVFNDPDEAIDLTQDSKLYGLQPVDPNMTTSGDIDFTDPSYANDLFGVYEYSLLWGAGDCVSTEHWFVNSDGETQLHMSDDISVNHSSSKDLGVYWIDNGIFTVRELALGYGVSTAKVISDYLNNSGGSYTYDQLVNSVNNSYTPDLYSRLGDFGTILLNMDANLVNLGTYLNNMATNLYTQVNYLTGTMNNLLTSINKNLSSQSGVDLSPVTELLESIDFNTQYTLNAISNWEENLATDMTTNMTSWFNNVLSNQGVINENMTSYIDTNNSYLQYILNAISNWEESLDLKLDASDSWFGSVLSYLAELKDLDVAVTVKNDEEGNSIWDNIKSFVAGALLEKVISAISDGLEEAFVPDDDYFSNKFSSWLELLPVKTQMDTYLGLTIAVAKYATEDKPSFTLGDTFAGVESSISSKRETYAEGTYENMAVSSFDSLTAQLSDVEIIDFSVFDDYKTIINAISSAILIYGFIVWAVHQIQHSFNAGGES